MMSGAFLSVGGSTYEVECAEVVVDDVPLRQVVENRLDFLPNEK